MEAILETKAEIILQSMRGLRGSLHVTFEEGTCTICSSPTLHKFWPVIRAKITWEKWATKMIAMMHANWL